MTKQSLRQRKALRSAAAKKGWETRRAKTVDPRLQKFTVTQTYGPPVTGLSVGDTFTIAGVYPPELPAKNWLHRLWAWMLKERPNPLHRFTAWLYRVWP